MLAEHFWRTNSGCGTVRWWMVCFSSGDTIIAAVIQWVTSAAASFDDHSIQAPDH